VSNLVSLGDQSHFEVCLRGISCLHGKKKFENLPLANFLINVLEHGEYLPLLAMCFEVESIVLSLVTSDSSK